MEGRANERDDEVIRARMEMMRFDGEREDDRRDRENDKLDGYHELNF